MSHPLLDSHHSASGAGATAVTSHGNIMGLGSCYVDCSDLGGLPFQSSVVDHALMGFEPTFTFQEHHHSDHEVDEERSNCSPTELSSFSPHHRQAGHENQIQFHTQQQAGWQSFRSNSSALEDDQNQQPLSPTEMAALRSSSPCLAHSSNNLYFGSSPLCQYTESGSIPPLAMELSQTPTMLRTGSTASEFSTGSSVNSAGVNPIHVNPLSQPVTPQDDIFAPLSDPFHQHWWANQNESHSVESLVTSLRASIGQPLQNSADHEVGARMPSIFAHPLKMPTSSPGDQNNCRSPSSPYSLSQQTKSSHSSPYHLPSKTRRTSHRSTLSNHNRTASSKISSRPFLIEPDYSRLPTKRSRGRRPPISPDLGLPIPDGHLSIGLQSVPGGQAFDPNLNPHAETVKYCELTKTGKPKKIFICQVKGCGKCFKRSEHLKRHVRSIHTNDKPYNCPWMACMKSFSRHDNLNQHLRVHRVEEGGEVLNGLHIGSDGVLRSDLDESPVDPVIRGLRDVEVLDRFMVDE
ncbi:zf-C2H2 Zinc finger, C2H2 type [Puccinia graminis f. sp. tritici]|nr:zf-C2H2 Zinc finger, C2H2 type [Puccinia graminis f. sp. tritici]